MPYLGLCAILRCRSLGPLVASNPAKQVPWRLWWVMDNARGIVRAGWMLALVAGCNDPVAITPPAATPEHVAPPPTTTPPEIVAPPPAVAEIPVPDHRSCGEAGPEPTALPPALLRGHTKIGRGTIKPGKTLQLGKVSAHYDPDAWIGNRSTGRRGHAVHLLVDRAEVGEHNPWGQQVDLSHVRSTHAILGPYHIHVNASAEDPPAQVEVVVTREQCPARTVIASDPRPQWVWISSAGIRQHSYDKGESQVQVVLNTHAATDHHVSITSHWGSYTHSWKPQAGQSQQVYTGQHRVAIDQVVIDGDDVHVRAEISAWRAPPASATVSETSECGDPSPAYSKLPKALQWPLETPTTHVLGPGKKLEVESLRFENTEISQPPPPYPQPALKLDSPWGSRHVFPGREEVARLGQHLVRMAPEPDKPKHVRIETTPVACAYEVTVPPTATAQYVWLSTVGHASIFLDGAQADAAWVKIHPDLSSATAVFSLSSAGQHASGRVRPEMTGHGYRVGNHLVEFLDVIADDHKTHIQVRITPL